MRIDIHIEDATPEILQRLFGTTVLPKAVEKVVAQSTVKIVSTPDKKPEQTKRSGNRYGIPSSMMKSDKKKYQRLWYRCKARGIMYEEALLLEKATYEKPVVATEPHPLLSEIKLDTLVRQTGGSRVMSGIGTVIKIRGSDILVRFDNGASWMQREHITVVTETEG